MTSNGAHKVIWKFSEVTNPWNWGLTYRGGAPCWSENPGFFLHWLQDSVVHPLCTVYRQIVPKIGYVTSCLAPRLINTFKNLLSGFCEVIGLFKVKALADVASNTAGFPLHTETSLTSTLCWCLFPPGFSETSWGQFYVSCVNIYICILYMNILIKNLKLLLYFSKFSSTSDVFRFRCAIKPRPHLHLSHFMDLWFKETWICLRASADLNI